MIKKITPQDIPVLKEVLNSIELFPAEYLDVVGNWNSLFFMSLLLLVRLLGVVV